MNGLPLNEGCLIGLTTQAELFDTVSCLQMFKIAVPYVLITRRYCPINLTLRENSGDVPRFFGLISCRWCPGKWKVEASFIGVFNSPMEAENKRANLALFHRRMFRDSCLLIRPLGSFSFYMSIYVYCSCVLMLVVTWIVKVKMLIKFCVIFYPTICNFKYKPIISHYMMFSWIKSSKQTSRNS